MRPHPTPDRSTSGRNLADPRADAGFERTDPAAADRDRVAVRRRQLDEAAVAGALEPDHPLDVDDVAAMHAHEPGGVEPRFHVADGERAEQLGGAVENVGV